MTSKPGLTTEKVLWSVWWDWQRIGHYELHPYDKTLSSDLDCQKVEALVQKRSTLDNRKRGMIYQGNEKHIHTS